LNGSKESKKRWTFFGCVGRRGGRPALPLHSALLPVVAHGAVPEPGHGEFLVVAARGGEVRSPFPGAPVLLEPLSAEAAAPCCAESRCESNARDTPLACKQTQKQMRLRVKSLFDELGTIVRQSQLVNSI